MCVYIRVETERSFVGERCRLGPRCCVAWYSSEPEHISAPQTAGPTLHHPHPQLLHHRCLLTRRMPMAVHCLPGAGPPLQGTISLCTSHNRSLTRSNAVVCGADVYTINYKYYFIEKNSWEPNQFSKKKRKSSVEHERRRFAECSTHSFPFIKSGWGPGTDKL